MQATTQAPELTAEKVNEAVEAILAVLGEPESDLHREALTAFRSGDHQRVKRLSSTNLADNYVKSLGYLGSAFKLLPTTDTILSESARSAADYVKDKALNQLGSAIAKALD